MHEYVPGHRLGFPPTLAPIEPDARPLIGIARPRYDEGAKYRQAVAFFEDWRAMRRMNAKSAVIGTPRQNEPVDQRKASFEDFNEKLANDTDAYAHLIEMRGGCRCHMGCAPCHPCSSPLTEDEALALGWEPPESEKPTKAELHADGGWITYSGRRCPLEVGTWYECMRASGRFSRFIVDGQDFDVGSFWNHDPEDGESRRQRWLVKYRVVPA